MELRRFRTSSWDVVLVQPISRYTRLFLRICGCVLALAALTAMSRAQTTATEILAWSDEFNGPAGTLPNPANWTYDTGDGARFGNPEIEFYCKPGTATPPCAAGQPNAFLDGDGHLVIRAVRDAAGQWTSARLKTQGLHEFQYGRVEARMKLPAANGFWPAFWMLGTNIDTRGWPASGEQDVIEWVQKYTPTTTSSTTHGPGYSGGKGITKEFTFPDGGRVDTDFHIYGVSWNPGSLRYYRDTPSNVFLTLTPATLPPGGTWAFDHPFFILLNLAIGSGGFPGPTDASTPPTATMLVDWVRVYGSASGTPLTVPTTPAPPSRRPVPGDPAAHAAH